MFAIYKKELRSFFITVVNKSEEDDTPTRYTRRAKAKPRTALEAQVAAGLVADADKKREENSALGIDEDEE